MDWSGRRTLSGWSDAGSPGGALPRRRQSAPTSGQAAASAAGGERRGGASVNGRIIGETCAGVAASLADCCGATSLCARLRAQGRAGTAGRTAPRGAGGRRAGRGPATDGRCASWKKGHGLHRTFRCLRGERRRYAYPAARPGWGQERQRESHEKGFSPQRVVALRVMGLTEVALPGGRMGLVTTARICSPPAARDGSTCREND